MKRLGISNRRLVQLGAALVLTAVAPSLLLSGCADSAKNGGSPAAKPSASGQGQDQGQVKLTGTQTIEKQQNLAALSSAEIAELKDLANENGLSAVLEGAFGGGLIAAAWTMNAETEKKLGEQLIKILPRFVNVEVSTQRAVERLKNQLSHLNRVEQEVLLTKYVQYFLVEGKAHDIASPKFAEMFKGIIDDLGKILITIDSTNFYGETSARILRDQYRAGNGVITPAMADEMRSIMRMTNPGYHLGDGLHNGLLKLEKKILDARLAFKTEFRRVFTSLGGTEVVVKELAANPEMQKATAGLKGRLFIGAGGLVLVAMATKDIYDIVSDSSGEVNAVKRKHASKRKAIAGS